MTAKLLDVKSVAANSIRKCRKYAAPCLLHRGLAVDIKVILLRRTLAGGVVGLRHPAGHLRHTPSAVVQLASLYGASTGLCCVSNSAAVHILMSNAKH